MRNNWVGMTLGKVHIETLIAHGGMAEVYLGTHSTLQRKVAVKILRNTHEEYSDDLERFKREAHVVASLRHPNIVQVYDFDMVDIDPYLVMEYVEGPSLSTYLHYLQKNGKKLELPYVAHILRRVADALQHAHNNKIVHRDIKPGNILLTSSSKKIELDKPLPEDFVPVLTDFGLIRFLDSARRTTTGITAGTPAYMSPEQAQGEITDGRTDVYSLGIVLYEMLAGKLPFEGETTVGILLKHVNEPPAPIPGLTIFMQNVLFKALAKKRGDRFQSPAEFANAFSAAVDINPTTIQMDALASDEPYIFPTEGLTTSQRRRKSVQPKRTNWRRIAIFGITALVLGTFLLLEGIPSLASNPGAGSPGIVNPFPLFPGPVTQVPLNLEPSLVLHFRDENAIADHAFLEAIRISRPPSGNRYEVWLFNNSDRISLGILSLDTTGNGSLIFTDEDGANLLAKYDQAEVTLEPVQDTSPQPTTQIAFSFSFPSEGIVHIRNLLSSFPTTPERTALIQGLYTDIQLINGLAEKMDSAYSRGSEPLARQSAEAILNLIVGAESTDYQDWDQDGFIADDSDGYGLERNGSSPGYLEMVSTETDNAEKSRDASQPILVNGEPLKTCVQNLAQWTPQLQELIVALLETQPGTDLNEQIVDINILAGQMLNGVDLDGDGNIRSTAGECGANSAFVHAYAMADMPLESTGLVPGTGNETPSGGVNEPTLTGNPGSN